MNLQMAFVAWGEKKPEGADIVFEKDNWNDHGWETKYRAFLPKEGYHTRIGSIKISSAQMAENKSSTKISGIFSELGNEFFSLGQSETFFKNLYVIDSLFAKTVLAALREASFDSKIYEAFCHTPVFQKSLSRDKSDSDLIQFRRLAQGDFRKIRYDFSYALRSQDLDYELTFAVDPGSKYPDNLHAIIGSNGVGKTSLFKDLVRIISQGSSESGASVEFRSDDVESSSDEKSINKIVFASFSIFDQEEIAREIFSAKQVRADFVGLLEEPDGSADSVIDDKPSEEAATPKLLGRQGLSQVLSKSLKQCLAPAHRERLRLAIRELSVDPVFEALHIERILDTRDFDSEVDRIFADCSSGHSICLLLTARLIELVEERTLVLFDEPESHLHPPLLSALMSVIKSILEDRNAIGILATHSPVVLQELPKSRGWMLTRFEDEVEAHRPDVETLGENVGVLTREVFELQLRRTGYNCTIRAMYAEGKTKSEILSFFGGSLGSEARALINTLS